MKLERYVTWAVDAVNPSDPNRQSTLSNSSINQSIPGLKVNGDDRIVVAAPRIVA
jgi:hypothetical protein